MNFIYPSFLWALAALAIPIIIHLFHFRRFKKIYFSNVKFLQEIKEETASRSNLKHLLVLLARLLALAFLVLAFAQPFIAKNEQTIVKGKRAISIFIDNSFSMNARNQEVSLLEMAKAKAREVAKAYSPEDRYQLITQDLEGRHQRLVSRDEVLAYIDEVKESNQSHNLTEIQQRQKQVLAENSAEQKTCVYISDFQQNLLPWQNDSSLAYYFVPIQAYDQKNLFIDSVWMDSPVPLLNETNKLVFRLVNAGPETNENAQLTLKINNETKAVKELKLEPNSAITDTVGFTIAQGGWNQGELSITDYPIDFDDHFYFSFHIEDQSQVLCINSGANNTYLDLLYKNMPDQKLVQQGAGQVNYNELNEHKLIILTQLPEISSGLSFELKKFIEEGGSLLIFPSENININSYNNFLKSIGVNTIEKLETGINPIGNINPNHPLFKGVFQKVPKNLDLPTAKKSFLMTRYAKTGEEQLMQYKNGNSFISTYKIGQGQLIFCTAPLDKESSDFATHPLFAPFIHKVTISAGTVPFHSYFIGSQNNIEAKVNVEGAENVLRLSGDKGEFIPGQRLVGNQLSLNINNGIKEAGLYNLMQGTTNKVAAFGFNYGRKESDMKFLDKEAITQNFKAPNAQIIENVNQDLKSVVSELDKGIPLWKWCIVLCLVFLAMEILLLRLWKS